MRKGNHRYPTAPLLAEFADLTAAQLCGRFGVTRTTIIRWRQPNFTLNQWDADRYAIMIGKHPGEIWADWFEVAKKDTVGV
jgi:hypothetical protein